MFKTICVFFGSAVIILNLFEVAHCDIEYNTINEDGSFHFGHQNDDIGGYYHSASGTPDNIVRGRYGSRNPATGKLEETVYTAGPRGFRVMGPKIHRKTNLEQYPPRPRGSPDDPLADPYADPSYSFSYRTADQSRSEDNDASGRVRGLYSFLDDEGVRHSVRYAAGAGSGFEVTNSVPDNPIDVGYTGPLYKAPRETRGKMTVQRGPDGTYKLLAAGPDHRRAESRSPDGLVRGTYSFLDDKGVQRTVEYIAGAGIGYRVLKNKVGPGTHVNNQVLDFRLNDASFQLANDFGTGVAPGAVLSDSGGEDGARRVYKGRGGSGGGSNTNRDYVQTSATRVDTLNENDNQIENADELERGGAGNNGRNGGSMAKNNGKENRIGMPKNGGRGSSAGGGHRAGSMSSKERDFMLERGNSRNNVKGRNPESSGGNSLTNNKRKPNRGQPAISNRNRPIGPVSSDTGGGYNYDHPPSSNNNNNYDVTDDDFASALPPLVTANHKILEIDRERDWVERHRDSTVIKNVGKWYLGLPPGQSVRAHVQNIDILPLGGRRVPSPSEALRQDELADMAASIESDSEPYRS